MTTLVKAALHTLTASEAVPLLARRELRAEELMRACLEHTAIRDPEVHAFAHLDPEVALARARALDAGPVHGLLHGLPLGVKDLFDTFDLPTAYGSPIYAGHRPTADAAAVALCREAGGVVMGKTVTTEFAYFHPGPTRNPHGLAHTPGGSSSGSAAAVADSMLPLALGTQTAGSIIRPAAYCGVVGYKPTAGRVPRAGVKSLSETLDTVGAFGRSVSDVALLGAVLTGDCRLLTLPSPGRPRIGLCRTPAWPQVDADTAAMWEQAAAALASIADLSEVDMPAEVPDLVALQKDVMCYEMARAFSDERIRHPERLSGALSQLFREGTAISGEAHAAHLAAANAASRRVDAMFDAVDILIAPSAAGEAPEGVDKTGDPVFCRGWTLLGLPCVHLPIARGRHGLPLGLQCIGRSRSDHQLLAIAQFVMARLVPAP